MTLAVPVPPKRLTPDQILVRTAGVWLAVALIGLPGYIVPPLAIVIDTKEKITVPTSINRVNTPSTQAAVSSKPPLLLSRARR